MATRTKRSRYLVCPEAISSLKPKKRAFGSVTFTNGSSPLEHLPDELLSHIAEYCSEYWHFITPTKFQAIVKDTHTLQSSSTLYSLSMVNKRLRRIYLPWLFRTVCFKFYFQEEDPSDEIQGTRNLLHQYVDFAKHIRFVHFATDGYSDDHRRRMLPLVLDVLHTCLILKWITLPRFFAMSQWEDQVELLDAVNNHPSTQLRIVYPCARVLLPRPGVSSLPPVCALDLSRVTLAEGAIDFRDRSLFPIIQAVTDRGVHVEDIASYDDSPGTKAWRSLTYPRLRIVHGWIVSESCQWPELEEFIDRHPQLEEIRMRGLTQENVPWLAAVPWARFVADLPKECIIDILHVGRKGGQWGIIYAGITLRHEDDEGEQVSTTTPVEVQNSGTSEAWRICEQDKKVLRKLGEVLPANIATLSLKCQHPRMSCLMEGKTFRVDSEGKLVEPEKHISDVSEIVLVGSGCKLFERSTQLVGALISGRTACGHPYLHRSLSKDK
ncbi:hypothetical protein D9758_002835 [Tetrapyrgos nigripes]|uniref:Uncharacterized protein n=1 Tax=Tetrapyrgos nigripes TaxID=182062 RepID=A0A8H5GPK4_9AGAR|nr:hypothetical protein D9758_002835 [Tetrapyrgos nigripes]